MNKISELPQHIAIIMDGNRRWAKSHNLPVVAGHRAGAETLRKIIEACMKYEIKYLTVYAFSTENWKRSPQEVTDLMNLMREYLEKLKRDNKDRNAKIKIIGDITRLDKDLQEKIAVLQESTCENTGLTINVALNYGGRDEIIQAIKKMSASDIQNLSPETFSQFLYTSDSPDPDLIIRTAGEQRLSNFLLWQAAYAEFYYTEVLWPDFSTSELDKALNAFSQRVRKFGGR
ncbi:MAG: di-trans,poly-cis-decaprenylcistransferase [Clostridia bacterium]|nr:di-trans,poly-cis-decaprenylcistransferase [Clostridia bacterium]